MISIGKREYWIDFIKGVAVLSVILLHSIAQPILIKSFAFVHLWQAVPIFIFISFYLTFHRLDTYGQDNYYSALRLKKLTSRIIVPYVFLQIVFCLLYICNGRYGSIFHLIMRGGDGMGSYYPYLYIQLWLIAPVVYYILNFKHGGGYVILLISIVINILTNTIMPNDRVYSCFIGRYLFMSVVAWHYLKQPNSILWKYILPLISILYWISLSSIDLYPCVDNRWSTQQFPSFFYTFFFVSFISWIYEKLGNTIKDIFTWMGRNSYQIFIIQMFVFHLFSIEDYLFITSDTLRRCVFVLTSVTMSIIPYYIYSIIKKHLICR